MENKHNSKYKFKAVERYVAPAPIPYVIDENGLPKNHKVLVFLPHSDDGRYIGTTLYLMNKTNDIKIIVMSTGYHGVDEEISKKKKIEKRWGETCCWAETLGIQKEQLVDFRADETYDTQKISDADSQKLHWLLEYERPTMIFVPHLSDTVQPINYNTRRMVVNGLLDFVCNGFEKDKDNNIVLLVEYPTNHVPILPPSDKNFIVVFSDPAIAEVKHQANKAHETQLANGVGTTERFVEAVEAVTEADTISQISKKRRFAHALSSVDVSPTKSRGEHFGITKVGIKDEVTPIIEEERLKFPLSKKDTKIWNNN